MMRYVLFAVPLLLLPLPAAAKGYPRGVCMCWTGGLAVHFKAKWTASCQVVCNAPERRPDLRRGLVVAPTDVSAPQRHVRA